MDFQRPKIKSGHKAHILYYDQIISGMCCFIRGNAT